MTTYTPMIQQYLQVKAQYQDAFVFFRLGDFYELFFEDAENASQLLEITLTSRDAGTKDRIPMCGVPHHSAKNYIETLIQKGYKVAICEQTEDPKQAKGVVRREVVQLITPGTIIEGKTLEGKSNHFIAAAQQIANNRFGYAYLDMSTGEAVASILEGDARALLLQLQAYAIRELVVETALAEQLALFAKQVGIVLSVEDEVLAEQKQQMYCANLPSEVQESGSRLLRYIEKTQMRALAHIQPFSFNEVTQYLNIDASSKRNLELIQSLRGGDNKGTLLWLLDDTATAMGGRKLKQWLHQPLASRTAIEARLAVVTELLDAFFVRTELQQALKKVYDLERLAGRVAFGNVGGRDLAQLRDSLQQVPIIQEELKQSGKAQLQKLAEALDICEDVEQILAQAITDHPPIAIKEGDVMRDNYNDQLDALRDASRNGKDWLAQLEQDERQRTGIKNLKIGYNRIFGYYIEITKSNIHLADLTRYERKQTLANAERYITEELKEKESIILHAEEQSLELEYQLFVALREQLKAFIPRVQALASAISELDVLVSFATVSEKYRFTKPNFHNTGALMITEGRHPVVEKMLNKQVYVPNDCLLSEEQNMMLITGPNMSGKSTYMRQVALIVVMAQMGCYVPATEANLPITDQIFTRIGAADDLASGQSTFMVEMLESQHAITHATKNSLLLFDEIGRGTSTYDGMALAQAMMEYIHNDIGANTLFSTHYHELTSLEGELARLQNVHVTATEKNGHVVFLHKVKQGAADKSYGIHVAELAALPQPIIERAFVLLNNLEQQKPQPSTMQTEPQQVTEQPAAQLSFFAEDTSQPKQTLNKVEQQVLATLAQANIISATPMEAINLLYDLQQKLQQK